MKTTIILFTSLMIFIESKTFKIDNFFISHTLTDIYLEGTLLSNFTVKKTVKRFIRGGVNKKHRPEEFYNFLPKSRKDFSFTLSVLSGSQNDIESIIGAMESVSLFMDESKLRVHAIGNNYIFIKEVAIPDDRVYYFYQSINKNIPRNKIIEYSTWWEKSSIKVYQDRFD